MHVTFPGRVRGEVVRPIFFVEKMVTNDPSTITVGQEIFADMIFSRILTKPRKYHVSEYDVNDLFTKKV